MTATLFAVLGCVTHLDEATPYGTRPATSREAAVENWYLAACANIGVDPDAACAGGVEHEELIDIAHGLRNSSPVFSDCEAFTVWEFSL